MVPRTLWAGAPLVPPAQPAPTQPEQVIHTAKQLLGPVFGDVPAWQEFLDRAMAMVLKQASEMEDKC